MIIMKSSSKNKGWCDQEDRLIEQLVSKHGTKNWALISHQLHLVYGYSKKSGKQCRQRWHNHLDPLIVKNSWTRAEQDILFQQHKKYGNKWTLIASNLPGRTDNSIKNHFYSTVRKSLRRVSKFLGSKNSTFKMRSIKPSTLSKIFTLAEEKPDELAEDWKGKGTPVNYKEIAQYIMNFARCKLSDRKYVMDQEQKKKFQTVLQHMVQINNIYENKKIIDAKEKKQELLKKNFDKVVSSEQEEDSDSSPLINVSMQKEKAQAQQRVEQSISATRLKRKSKPVPKFQMKGSQKRQKKSSKQSFEQLNGMIGQKERELESENESENEKNKKVSPIIFEKQEIKQQENNHVLMKNLLLPSNFQNNQNVLSKQEYQQPVDFSRKDNQFIASNFDFHVDLGNQHETIRGSQSFGFSPRIGNSPFPLTPNQNFDYMKQMAYPPLKNEQCTLMMNMIMQDIKKNTNIQFEGPPRIIFLASPTSAFRHYY